MSETGIESHELPNLITLAASSLKDVHISESLIKWEAPIFSLIIIFIISFVASRASKRKALVPGRLQNFFELYTSAVDDFVTGIIGHAGRKYTPFIGTLFIYILAMNLFGLIPFMKSPTTSWSTTLALALCVFVYVQYTAFKELGFFGYVDHMMGRPRGMLALSVVIPLIMFFLHIVAELVRPVSLSLRLRSNIWGDDTLLAVLAGFGMQGVPLLFFNTLLVIITSVVQAVVFCLLTTIYFALVLVHEE